MDVELRDLLADYSPAIRSWLTELGLETCLDVRHMWQSAAAMESEWSDGPGQSQGASLQVASLYAEAVRRSAVTARKRVLDLTMERQSRFVSQDAKRNVARLAPPPSSSKPKMLLLHRQSACDVTVVTSADPVPRSAPSADAQKAWKIKALFCIACEIFLDPADIGAANLDFFDEQAVSQASDLAMTSAQRLSPKRLAAIMATLRVPADWAMPPVKFLGINLVSELRKFFLEDALPDRPFLWPAVDLSRDDLWQVSEATSFRLERKMSGPRFLEIARGVISQCGVDVKAATATKFNRLARVSDATAALFIQKHKLESLEDFVYVVERASWETSLKELAEAVPELRGDRLVLARLKAAYEAGFAAVHNSQAVEKQDASDLDQPIPDNFFQQLDQEWKRSYNLPIEAHLDPCDSLRGRIWRELRRRTLTLLELRKVRSVIGGSAPLEEEKISLDGGVTLQFAKEGYAAPKNVIEYYLRLRTLCVAWAWCGNFRQKCLDGKDKLVMPLHVSLDYADMALRHCSSYGSSSLAWLQRNDLLTRGSMCAKVRRGMTAAVALQEALHETHLEWRSPGPRALEASVGTPGGPKSGGKRLQEDTTPPPPPAKVPRVHTVSMAKGGRKLCKAWNDGRGCQDNRCDAIHARLPSGCLSKTESPRGLKQGPFFFGLGRGPCQM
eukprot:s3206_g5.t1